MKPCPFCGERAMPLMRRNRDMFDNEICIEFGVKCAHCGSVVFFKDCYELDHAIECWNRRAEE